MLMIGRRARRGSLSTGFFLPGYVEESLLLVKHASRFLPPLSHVSRFPARTVRLQQIRAIDFNRDISVPYSDVLIRTTI
jgi:hypothetical protein